MNPPTLSLCIPTYNRDKYLRCLLGMLLSDIGQLSYSYEIVIADNGSTDQTEAVVAEYRNKLNIRYIKRDKNYGLSNGQFVMSQARGQIQLYVADDDALILSEVNAIVTQMMLDPSIGVVFAPWYLHDLVNNKTLSTFYQQDADRVIDKEDYAGLLSLILQHSIFPEIYICRRDLMQAVRPRANKHAFFAFVNAAEYLAHARVLFRKQPFYVSITQYFADEHREQIGHLEVEDAWDRYRGGLEYILSRIPEQQLTAEQRHAYTAQIQHMIAQRLGVALRIRISRNRDMVDNYYLACRLIAMGYPQYLPVPLSEIKTRAAFYFVCKDECLLQDIRQIIVIGSVTESVQQFMQTHAPVPVSFQAEISSESCMEGVLACIPGSIFDLPSELQISSAPRVIGLADMVKKFD